jgi:hypothetical protein
MSPLIDLGQHVLCPNKYDRGKADRQHGPKLKICLRKLKYIKQIHNTNRSEQIELWQLRSEEEKGCETELAWPAKTIDSGDEGCHGGWVGYARDWMEAIAIVHGADKGNILPWSSLLEGVLRFPTVFSSSYQVLYLFTVGDRTFCDATSMRHIEKKCFV